MKNIIVIGDNKYTINDKKFYTITNQPTEKQLNKILLKIKLKEIIKSKKILRNKK